MTCERQRDYLFAGLRMGLAVVLLVSVPLAILPDRFLAAWLPDGDFERERGGAGAADGHASSSRSPATCSLSSSSRGAATAASPSSGSAAVTVNLILSIVLASLVGIWGVALATLVTEAVATAVVTPLLVRRETGVALAPLARAWLRPIVLAAIAALPTLVAARLLAIDTLLEFTAVGAVWAVVYAAVFWRWGLDERERATLLRAFAGGRPTQPALAEMSNPEPGGTPRSSPSSSVRRRSRVAPVPAPPRRACLANCGIAQHPLERRGQRCGVVGRNQQARSSPSATISGIALTFVATTGNDASIASSSTSPKPSQRAGWTQQLGAVEPRGDVARATRKLNALAEAELAAGAVRAARAPDLRRRSRAPRRDGALGSPRTHAGRRRSPSAERGGRGRAAPAPESGSSTGGLPDHAGGGASSP